MSIKKCIGAIFTALTMAIMGCADCNNNCQITMSSDKTDTPVRPNYITLVIDDMGFSDIGVFGGEVPTPNIDELANDGVLLTNFYAMATSTPSRAMLFSGKDNHQAGVGNMGGWIKDREEQIGQPGYEGVLTLDVPAFAELLRDDGYQTMITGKWDLGEEAEEYYPINRGFTDARAVLLTGGDNQYSEEDGTLIPTLPPVVYTVKFGPDRSSPFNDNGKVLEKFPREFYSTDYYTDMAIEMLKNRDKDKPFSLSICHTATHSPWQAPADVTAKYIDTYAKGWDVLREERFARQKAMGLFPQELELPPRPDDVPAWDSLTQEEQEFEAKRMAVYAAMIDVLDQNIGRLVDYLKEIGVYENTVIFFFSDNGAAYAVPSNPGRQAFLDANFDNSYENIGNRNSYIGGTKPWGMLSNTPFGGYKADMYDGGIHTAAFVHYPKSKSKGIKYSCLTAVTDIAATILDMSDTEYPRTYKGKYLSPLQGSSWQHIFDGDLVCDSEAWLAWEQDGAKGVRKGDWKLSQKWDEDTQCWDDDWHLFNLSTDPFESNDLVGQELEKLNELNGLYEQYAYENGVIWVDACPFADDDRDDL